MKRPILTFRIEQSILPSLRWGDAVVFLSLVVLVYVGVRLAFHSPAVVEGPRISLHTSALPWYAGYSIARMLAAYLLSLLFTLVYGHMIYRNRKARFVLLPLLDILQSVPILSFLPVVLLSLSTILPQGVAAELSSIILIFTSQAWNMTFAWYQSLITIPHELSEVSETFRFNGWLRFKVVQLPFAAIGLIWNSIMSWAGGWFFLMAAEIFTLGQRDFRLPGLGAYLHEAASKGDMGAIAYGVITLVLVITALDQLVWRPLLAWSERFKLEMVESDSPRTSWFYDALRVSRLLGGFQKTVWKPFAEKVDAFFIRVFPAPERVEEEATRTTWKQVLAALPVLALLAWGLYRTLLLLGMVGIAQWGAIGLGVSVTFLRVVVSILIALAWTIPLGVVIGTNPRFAALLQPVVQIAASVPATALFPVFLLLLLNLPGGLSVIAVLLMLLGTQWYLLFNVIAGASAIPQDLKYTTTLLQLGRWGRWKHLILPSLFPYIITGAIAAGGGAWNASIVAEYVEFGGRTLSTVGIGSLIAQATATADYPLLLASTLTMITTVVLINRLFWRRLYRLAEERYRME